MPRTLTEENKKNESEVILNKLVIWRNEGILIEENLTPGEYFFMGNRMRKKLTDTVNT